MREFHVGSAEAEVWMVPQEFREQLQELSVHSVGQKQD